MLVNYCQTASLSENEANFKMQNVLYWDSEEQLNEMT